MKLKNSVAVITGGASGLGEAVVRRVVAKGGKAAIFDLDSENGELLSSELGSSAIFISTDVSSEDNVTSSIDKTVETYGAINICINCAGIAAASKVIGKKGAHDLDLFKKVIEVNLVGTFNIIRLVTEKMILNNPGEDEERGVIINTASVAAYEGQIGQAAYSASKSGIVGLTLPIARELAERGIRVVSIAPGIMETPMLLGMPDNVKDSLAKMVPFPKRLGLPDEFANLAEHIIENRFINGTTIRLDGAIRMQPR